MLPREEARHREAHTAGEAGPGLELRGPGRHSGLAHKTRRHWQGEGADGSLGGGAAAG